MGLLSKIGSGLGIVKNKAASSIGAIKASAGNIASKVPVLGKVAKVAAPIARVGFAVAKRVSTPLAVAGAAVGVAKFIKARREKKDTGAAQVVAAAKVAKGTARTGILGSKLKTAAAVVGGVAAGGAIAYGVEQLAEKAGIRGGAGFFGARPRKSRSRRRRGKGRYAYIRVRRNRRGPGRLTRTEESRLRSTARRYEASEGTSRRHRKHHGRRYPYWLKKYMFKKGHRARRRRR